MTCFKSKVAVNPTRLMRKFLICCLAIGAAASNLGAAEPTKIGAASAIAPSLGHEVGEVEIRELLPLSPPQRAALRQIAATDVEANALLQTRLTNARALLKNEPNPLAAIDYEGLVNTDPRRMKAVERLAELDDAAALFEAWQATDEPQFAAAARRYVGAWAATYQPTGNDVNENKLLPLMMIYQSLRADYAPDERAKIDDWLSEIARKGIATAERQPKLFRTNRYTKTLRIVATIGLALDKKEWLDYASAGLKEFVSNQLYADGGSYDLKRRDTLTYHSSSLRPLLDLAVLAARQGDDLYRWSSPSGSSLQKSVDYVVPYATGEKQRREWTNSEVELDRKRAAAGLEAYRAGRLYEPKSALDLMQQAAYFDASLLPLAAKLAGGEAQRFPTWRAVVNEAVRCAAVAENKSA